MLMRLLTALVMGLTFAAAQGASLAPPDPHGAFYEGTLRDALDESKERFRMLVVYVRGDPKRSEDTARMDEVTWTNPVVAAWIKWHAIACRVSFMEEPALAARLGVTRAEEGPVVLFFIDGREVARLPRQSDLPVISVKNPFGEMTGYQGPAFFTFFMDFTLQRVMATDPIFGAMHEEHNPPPEPPPPSDPFHTIDDGLAPTIADPVDDRGAIDVLEMLTEARRAVALGDLHRATGLYTWLWERAAEVDPAFRPMRRSILAEEMRQLARRRSGARKRFTAMRDEASRRILWADFDEIFEWFVLNEIIGEEGESLRKLDFEMNDPQMTTMMPRADLLAYRIMTARDRFADPAEIGENPVERIRRLASFARSRPRNVHPDDWPAFQTFARTHLLDEACRLHAACLGEGRSDDAAQIAAQLLAARDEALSRRALVATALAAGEPRPEHERWLAEAEAMGEPSPVLSERLRAALEAAPHP